MKKTDIGVFLGSFNPPHIGHEHIITSAWNSNLFNKIYIIPAYQNPWKCGQTNYPTYEERFHMCDIMFGNLNPNIIVSDFEKIHYNKLVKKSEDKVITYTYEMLLDFEKTNNCKVDIITTVETFMDIINWHCGVEMLNEFNYYIIRDTSANWCDFVKYINDYRKTDHNLNYKIIDSDGINTNISSTKIRTLFSDYNMFMHETIIPHYTNDDVINYIKYNHFYANW